MSMNWYSIVAIIISAIALLVATKNYRRKAGVLVRGGFSMSSSRDCVDRYVSQVLIENLKDRAITIFAIYLRVGHNYYIEIEDLEESPLVLKAYETFHKQYGPIQFYGLNSNKVDLNSLFENEKVRKRLVLSTSDGKYVVPAKIKHWHPVGDFFKNHMTATLRPVRLLHKKKHIGGNIKYVVEFIPEEGEAEVVTIHPRDHELKMFRAFSLTLESLESVDSLRNYLQRKQEEGLLNCKCFEVHDVTEWKLKALDFYDGRTIHARYYGFWMYHLFGRLGTLLSDRALKKKNEKMRMGNNSRQQKVESVSVERAES
jgi:hypothetical protein